VLEGKHDLHETVIELLDDLRALARAVSIDKLEVLSPIERELEEEIP
jgi:hypothetical protein